MTDAENESGRGAFDPKRRCHAAFGVHGHCKGCRCPVAKGEPYCGECMCEDDGL